MLFRKLGLLLAGRFFRLPALRCKQRFLPLGRFLGLAALGLTLPLGRFLGFAMLSLKQCLLPSYGFRILTLCLLPCRFLFHVSPSMLHQPCHILCP